ncbi:MAG: hypothetical protein JWP47_14 [Polaromonas sp.]|jgi:hypothetical protein|nr:hypothetical protein [Polaromonas sp.]
MRSTIKPAFAAASLLALAMATGCSPAFNWRDVRPEGARLLLLLPCKPDKAAKTVPLGGQPVELRMAGCDVGDLTFAVSVADVGDATRASPVLAQWQAATLANMKAPPVGAAPGVGQPAPPGMASQATPLQLAGAAPAPVPVLVKAAGTRPDGKPVQGQAAYFAQGTQVFQAVIYGEKIPPELADTFFGSLKFE